MPTIKLTTDFDAPIERVFDLARSIDAHVASASSSGERAVAGRTCGLIGMSETVTWQAKHFGIKQTLTVEISEFDRPTYFEDRMVKGAFASMCHTHRFETIGSMTRMHDSFTFRAPLGPLGRIAERLLLTRYMKRFLIERNQVLKQTAESDRWRDFLDPPRT